jgi:AMP phosphorylase
MELKTKILRWSAGVPVAMLNIKTAENLGVHSKDRIEIKTLGKNPKTLSTVVDTVKGLVREKEIAVSSELRAILGMKKGEKVEVNLATPPQSLSFIKKKLHNHILSKGEIDQIIKDVVDNSLSESEIALFVSAMYEHGMNMKETISLVESIRDSGNQLKLNNKFIVDKHSVGGIPGNRTTPIVVAICAASGLTIPKSSSRAITSAAGTADVIETIARVDFSVKEMKEIIRKTNGCMIWGGSLGLVTADDKILKVEKMLKIDPKAQLLASIMSKKLSVGSKYILIDIPYGKGAKVDKEDALLLKRDFEYLGRYFKKKLKCVLTDGTKPIGKGIGPILELRDIIAVLDPREVGPRDLEEKSVFLAGHLLEMTGKAEKDHGKAMAQETLDSGKAFLKFKEIIKAQSGSIKRLNPGKYQKSFAAQKTGKISYISNKDINNLARNAGCPLDKAAGLYLYFNVGEKVKKREKIITIYAESRARLNEAVRYYLKTKPIRIG